jgi:hypothetical protein
LLDESGAGVRAGFYDLGVAIMVDKDKARIDMSSSPLTGFEWLLLVGICTAAAVFVYMLLR